MATICLHALTATSPHCQPTASVCRLGVKAAPLHDFYPPHMTAAFVAALNRFDRNLPGFVRWAVCVCVGGVLQQDASLLPAAGFAALCAWQLQHAGSSQFT